MKKQHVTFAATDKKALENLLAKGSLGVKTFRRATALLELDRGKTYDWVAQMLGVRNETVSRWASSYQKGNLSLLKDKLRSGRPPHIHGWGASSENNSFSW